MSDSSPSDVLAQLFQLKPPETVEEMRELLDGLADLINAGAPDVGAFHPGVAIGDCTADVIVPKGDGPHPVLVYLHGGGWVCGSPRTHHKLAHRFAEAGHLVVNVGYRLAPEHPFPTPFEDCLDAVRWAAKEVATWGGDPARIALGGDSAGGNLSAAVAAALADEPSGPQVKAALLIYGVFDLASMSAEPPPEMAALSSQMPDGLGERLVEMMLGAYLGADRDAALLRDPRISPIHAAAKLPPTHIVCGTADPLLGQARALRAELERAGVEHEYFEDEGMPHGYAQMEFLPAARSAVDRMIAFLGARLGAG